MVGMLDDPDASAKILVEIIKAGGQLRQEIESRQLGLGRFNDSQEAGLRDLLKEWLEKVRQLAQQFGPESYSINLNIPFLGSLGFSWTLPAKHED